MLNIYHHKSLKIDTQRSYKVGINEVAGLETAMREIVAPLLKEIRSKTYWDRDSDFEVNEYKSRDGFIPYSDNCGGLEYTAIIPECESYDWSFLEFGEWDGEHYCDGSDKDNCECPDDNDGHYDAKFRVWFKFEGIEDGEMKFWLYMGGGNGDAPYFRTKYEATVFEASFTAKTLSELKLKAKKPVQDLLKIIKG